VPATDYMELASPDVRKEFKDLFAFAKKQGVLNEANRNHYSQRFAADPFGTRREIDLLIAGKQHSDLGTAAAHIEVQDLPGYPKPEPSDGLAYPEQWVPGAKS
jgi:hypothetical protein